MTQFKYTHTKAVSSSAVDEVHYNVDTKELAVNLHEEVYVYKNVPLSRYEALVTAPSVGRFFREIKSDYGPSQWLGRSYGVGLINVGVTAPSMDAVGTPKSLVHAGSATVPVAAPSNYNIRVNLGDSTQPVEDRGTTRTHSVLFSVEGLNSDREYSVDANNVDEAVKALTDATEALGLTVKVKEVTVYFE